MITGSIAGHLVYEGGGGYTAAKHGAAAIVETLRLELNGKPVRVTEVAPGIVRTEEFSLVRYRGDQAAADRVYAGVPGPLTADDVADCIAFAVTRPAHVNIDLLVVKPLAQAAPHKVAPRRLTIQSSTPRRCASGRSRMPKRSSTPSRISRASSSSSAVVAPPRLVSASECLLDTRDAVVAEALAVAGRLDQPRGGQLHLVVDRPVRAAVGHVGRIDERVDEERADAPGVVIGRVEQHALAAPQLQHDLAHLRGRRRLARFDAQPARELEVADGRRVRACGVSRKVTSSDDVAVGVLERARPEAEADPLRRPRLDGAARAVEHGQRGDHVGDLAAVRADVLHRRRAGQARDAGHRRESRPAVAHGRRDQVVPAHAGLRPSPRRRSSVDPARADEHDDAGPALVRDDAGCCRRRR